MVIFNTGKKAVLIMIVIVHIFVGSVLFISYFIYSEKTITRLNQQIEDLKKDEKQTTIELRDELRKVYMMKNSFQYLTGLPLADRLLVLEQVPTGAVNTDYPPVVMNKSKEEAIVKEMFKTTYKDITVRLVRESYSSYALESVKKQKTEPILNQKYVFPESVNCHSVTWSKSQYSLYPPEDGLYLVHFTCSTPIKRYELRQQVNIPGGYGMGGVSGLVQITINAQY